LYRVSAGDPKGIFQLPTAREIDEDWPSNTILAEPGVLTRTNPERRFSADEHVAILLPPESMPCLLFDMVAGRKSHHIHALADPEVLQEQLLPIGKPYGVAIGEGLGALLNKGNILDLAHSQAILQVRGNIA
jgi:hypothetical protein